MKQLIIAQVFDSHAATIQAFDRKVRILNELATLGLDFKVDYRSCTIECHRKLVHYFSKDQWVENAASRWHYVNFNFEPTVELVTLELVRERLLLD